MILPGETEAGSAGRQPCRGIIWRAHRADAQHSRPEESSDDRPACLENPRPAGAESTLTENVAFPFHAEPRRYSITTPKPISLAEGTTSPSAQATQHQNPYLGSVPEKATGTTIPLFLQDAIARGLRYNLGLVELQHGDACALAALARADLVLMEAALRQQLLALHVNG